MMADTRSESSYSYYDDPPASSDDVANDGDAPQEEGERYDEDELYSQYSSARSSSSQQYSPARSSSQYSYDSYSPAPSDRPANMPQRPMPAQPPKPPLMRIADALRSPHPALPPTPAQPHFSNLPPSQQASRSQSLDPTSKASASSPVQRTASTPFDAGAAACNGSNPMLTSPSSIHLTPALQDRATSTAPPIAGQDRATSTGGLAAPCMQERAMSAAPPLPVMQERATSGRSRTVSGIGTSAEPDGDDPILRASEAEQARCVFELARSEAPRLL